MLWQNVRILATPYYWLYLVRHCLLYISPTASIKGNDLGWVVQLSHYSQLPSGKTTRHHIADTTFPQREIFRH